MRLIAAGRLGHDGPGAGGAAGRRGLGDHEQHPDPRHHPQLDGAARQRRVRRGVRVHHDPRQHPAGVPDPVQLGARGARHAAAGAAGRLRRREPLHHDHRLDHGPRADPALVSPTSVVVVGGLAIAKVGYDKYLRFVWPLLVAMFVVAGAVVGVAATIE